MSEINEKKNNEKEEDEFDIKKIILISLISIGIIIILYYLFTPEWGDDTARIWNILEKFEQTIGITKKHKTFGNNEHDGLSEVEYNTDFKQ